MNKYYLSIEIGGTNLRYGVIDSNFSIVEFNKIPTKNFSISNDKIKFLSELIMPLIDKYGKDNIICITMALASLMNRERTVIYSSPMVKGFDNIKLVELLQEAIDIPVLMEKDVNILLLYEIGKMDLNPSGIVTGVFIGTGLGNAIAIDGKIYRGASGSASELGHIPVSDLEQECACGKKGCLELLACGRVLERLAVEEYQCDIEDIFIKHGNDKKILDVIYYLAIAIASEITILDPAYVILGGGVVESGGFPMEYLIDTIRENLRHPNPRESVKFIRASGDMEAGVVGAAISASKIMAI